MPHAELLSHLLTFLTLPFVLTTSWQDYLALLPFVQALLAWWTLRPRLAAAPGEVAGGEAARRFRKATALLLPGCSIVISNVLFFNLIDNRHHFGSAGFVF